MPCGLARRYGRQVLEVGDVIMKVDGKETGFMFTDRELEAPRRRAEIQREDAPKKRNFWQRVFKKRK